MRVKIGIKEFATITLHLNTLRKEVKKGFKKTYGASEGKKKIKVYQDLSNIFNEHTVDVDESQEDIEIYLPEEEKEMLSGFLDWYIATLQKQAEIEGLNDDNDVIKHLITVNISVKEINDEVSTF